MKKTLIAITAAAATLALALGVTALTRPHAATPDAPKAEQTLAHPLHGLEAVLYKSPTCGCCHGYAQALEAAGVRLTVIDDAAATVELKRQHGIPQHAYSCHTFTIAGYVAEGHVPLAALERLITERPDIDGIVLPGMPIGTPGMPGEQTAPYEVLSLEDGQLAPFMTL